MSRESGCVFGSGGGVYRVRLDSGTEVDASLRGRLKRQSRTGDQVVIGDRVGVSSGADGSCTIEEVEPRNTEIVRAGPGGRKPKVVAANVDRLLVVAAAARPEPRQTLLDRLLVLGEANDLAPILVMNKTDLVPGWMGRARGDLDEESNAVRSVRRLLDLYRTVGYRVLETSTVSGEGLEELSRLLCTGTSALLGPSGAGKSSLLNAIDEGLNLRTGELSHRRGHGRHTTVSARLIPLDCGGLVADTPGFSDVGVWGVAPREVEGCFPEFHPAREECRFRSCTHLHEPGCAVQEALSRGEVDPIRFESYRVLAEEASGR
jgi:ribosome biogenesis GTPase